MDKIKEEILSDAIKTVIQQERSIINLKRTIYALLAAIDVLVVIIILMII